MDLALLVTLEALLEERNVTRAAERLHLSQPATSARLRRLRTLFDDPLLVPAGRGMVPTARALALHGPLREALDRVRSTLAQHAGFDPARLHMTLTIACTDYVAATVALPFAQALRAHAPGCRVAVRTLDPARLEAQLARGDVDLAVMTPADAAPSLRARHLFHERYVLIGRRGHPRLQARLSIAGFCALEHVVVSLRGGRFRTPVDDALAARGLRRNVVLSVASFLTVPPLVAQSDLVALVPARLVDAHRDGVRVRACPFPVAGFDVGVVWHERHQRDAAQRWVRDRLVAFATDVRTGRP